MKILRWNDQNAEPGAHLTRQDTRNVSHLGGEGVTMPENRAQIGNLADLERNDQKR